MWLIASHWLVNPDLDHLHRLYINSMPIYYVFCRKQSNGVQSNIKGIETFTIPCSLEVNLEQAKVCYILLNQVNSRMTFLGILIIYGRYLKPDYQKVT